MFLKIFEYSAFAGCVFLSDVRRSSSSRPPEIDDLAPRWLLAPLAAPIYPTPSASRLVTRCHDSHVYIAPCSHPPTAARAFNCFHHRSRRMMSCPRTLAQYSHSSLQSDLYIAIERRSFQNWATNEGDLPTPGCAGMGVRRRIHFIITALSQANFPNHKLCDALSCGF